MAMLSPLRRYRPLGGSASASPFIVRPISAMADEDGYNAGAPLDLYGDDTTIDPQGTEAPAAPQMSKNPSMEGAAKLPPPMAGGPLAGTVNAPQSVAQPDIMDDDSPDAPITPTAMPPAMRGGPKPAIDPAALVADAVAAKNALQRPDVGKANKWQMLGAAALGGLQGYKNASRPHDPQMDLDIASIVRPKATQQMAKYGQQVADAEGKLKQADAAAGVIGKIKNIEALDRNRQMLDEDRDATRAETFRAKGGVYLPVGAEVPLGPDGKPSLLQLPAQPGSPKGTVAYYDPHYNDVFISKADADKYRLPEGFVKRDTWESVLKENAKLPKPETVRVSPATAAAMKIEANPGPDGLVEVPTTIHAKYLETSKTTNRNMTAADVLLEEANKPGTHTPAAVAEAKRQFGEMHRPPVNNFTMPNYAPGADGSANPVIEMYAKYQKAFPAQPTRNPQAMAQWNKQVEEIRKLNPKFNPETGLRAVKDFSGSGKANQNILAINTAANHISDLEDAIKAKNSGDMKLLNQVVQSYQRNTGGTTQADIDTIIPLLTQEISKAYMAAGGTVDERNAIAESLNAAKGYNAAHTALARTVKLFDGRVDALKNQYERDAAGNKWEDQPFISPKAQASFNRFMGGGGGRSADGTISVQIPGQPPGRIPASQKDAFLKTHPGAKVR